LKGILGFEERPLVSIDYKGDQRSTIVDALSTMVVGSRMVKIYAWYDNEMGYATRTAELVRTRLCLQLKVKTETTCLSTARLMTFHKSRRHVKAQEQAQ
ncbi:glyceraldehyde-3-phosphate dehydrogenase 3, partial [Vibrio parahaemolyticus AQ3810]